MDLLALQTLLDWIGNHPYWSGLIIFLIAFSESLALVGLLVPGAVLMFGLGTLITTGHLDFATTCVWAILGAIAGDGVSYWIGHHYREQLQGIWPLSRHPQLLERGTRFFLRHGGKSILFGRFVGPVRPIIPAIAGMYGMPLLRFFGVNILSGFAWAPLYLIPGMVFGLSLTLAGEVAGRLVVMVVGLLVSIMLLSWLLRRIYNLVLPHVDKILFRLANWSYQHPVAGQVPAALIRPEHPEVRILSLLALLLFIATALFISLNQFVHEQGLLMQFNKLLQHNLYQLQTPRMVELMSWIQLWSDPTTVLVIVIFTLIWLAKERHTLAIWHLGGALAFPLVLKLGLPFVFGPQHGQLFPSATTLLSTCVYGFIAVVLAREVNQRLHLLLYISSATLLFLIALAQLYLQLTSLSHVLSALTLGTIWMALLGIAYRRHVHHAYVSPHSLVVMVSGFFLILAASGLFVSPKTGLKQDVAIQSLRYTNWQTTAWQQLPRYRQDLRYQRQHPFNLQWSATADEIKRQLVKMGWQVPPRARGTHLLQWLNPGVSLENLPVLPHVHDGDYDVMRFVDYGHAQPRIIRLWPAHRIVQKAGIDKPLWVGSISTLKREKIMGLTLWRTSDEFVTAQQHLLHALQKQTGELNLVVKIRSVPTAKEEVLLLDSF